jgi:pimeloyl-ACP methyl ester carboxylesterase
MYEKDKKRMVEFEDWKVEDIHSINAPTLVIIGDRDIVCSEHAIEIFRLLPHARLSILPGIHGAYIGEVTAGIERSRIPTVILRASVTNIIKVIESDTKIETRISV